MEVILLEKVQNLGNIGERVNVRPGYGRNFLIPYGKAVPATEANLKQFEARRAELEKKAAEELRAAEERKTQLDQLPPVRITSKAGDEGKLFGSIGVRDIAQAVSDAGVALEKHEVHLPEGPIRNVGEYTIEVQVHPDVVGAVKIEVVPE